jgi:small Trp-rich protein
MYVSVRFGDRVVAAQACEIGPVAGWSWWPILGVYGAAAAWWAWADASGYTKRKAMEKMDQRKKERIERQKQAMAPGQRRR